MGRTSDLKAAYKQLGVGAQNSERRKIAVKKPGGRVNFFKVLALQLKPLEFFSVV